MGASRAWLPLKLGAPPLTPQPLSRAADVGVWAATARGQTVVPQIHILESQLPGALRWGLSHCAGARVSVASMDTGPREGTGRRPLWAAPAMCMGLGPALCSPWGSSGHTADCGLENKVSGEVTKACCRPVTCVWLGTEHRGLPVKAMTRQTVLSRLP